MLVRVHESETVDTFYKYVKSKGLDSLFEYASYNCPQFIWAYNIVDAEQYSLRKYIHTLAKTKDPVLIVNGELDDKSFKLAQKTFQNVFLEKDLKIGISDEWYNYMNTNVYCISESNLNRDSNFFTAIMLDIIGYDVTKLKFETYSFDRYSTVLDLMENNIAVFNNESYNLSQNSGINQLFVDIIAHLVSFSNDENIVSLNLPHPGLFMLNSATKDNILNYKKSVFYYFSDITASDVRRDTNKLKCNVYSNFSPCGYIPLTEIKDIQLDFSKKKSLVV